MTDLSAANLTDTWILPPPSHSSWFAKIDWYLNWQMSKGLAHEMRKPPVELLRLSEENGLPWLNPPSTANSPLMVGCRGRIPAKRCMVMNVDTSLKLWLTRISAVVTPAGGERLRVFLPKGSTALEAQEIWRSLSTSGLNAEFTSDEESTTWPTQSRTS